MLESVGEGPPPQEIVEAVARRFHEAYERLAPAHGWSTQEVSRVPWDLVPDHNRDLMRATIAELIEGEVIEPGAEVAASFRRRTARVPG